MVDQIKEVKVDPKTGITRTILVSTDEPVSYKRGSHKSVAKLRQLEFDPITTLVMQYRKIESELERQEKIRSGEVVELKADGTPKAYRVDIHMSLFDKLTNISKELLRYGYGRVPELNVLEQRAPMPLIVNLTRKGEQFVVNDHKHDEERTIENGE